MEQSARIVPITKSNSSLLTTLALLTKEIEENTKELNKINNNSKYQAMINLQHFEDSNNPTLDDYEATIKKRLTKLYSSKISLENSHIIDDINRENSIISTPSQETSTQNQDRCCAIS